VKPQPAPAAATPEWRHTLADAWVDWLRPVTLLAAAGALVAIYALGWLPQATYAKLVIVIAAGVLGIVPPLLAVASAPRWTLPVALATAFFWAAALVWPVFWTLTPGAPLLRQKLAEGAVIDAETSGGDFVLWVQNNDLARGERAARYSLSVRAADEAPRVLQGELPPFRETARKGAIQTKVFPAATAHTLTDVPAGPLRLRVQDVSPEGAGHLTVVLFAGAVPWRPLFYASLAFLLVAAVLVARGVPRGQRCFLLHAGVAVSAFLWLVPRHDVDPVAPVKTLLGVLLVAVFAGALAGEAVTWIARRTGPTRSSDRS